MDRTPSGDHQQKPVKKEQKSGTKGRSGEGNLKNQSQESQQSSPSPCIFNREVRQEVCHIFQNCPHSVEEPGRQLNASVTSSTNTVGSIQPVVPDEVTDEQPEQILMRRRLTHEQEKLSKSSTHSSTNSIESDNSSNKAVGPAMFVDVSIDGVTVHAMVDTGAQSTIISRTVLHQIGVQRH